MTSNPSGGLKRGDTQKISGSREDAMGTMLAAATEPDLPVHGRCTDVMVAALEAEGIEYCFGIPGEENLDFLDSLRTAKSLKLVLTRHEQAERARALATFGVASRWEWFPRLSCFRPPTDGGESQG